MFFYFSHVLFYAIIVFIITLRKGLTQAMSILKQIILHAAPLPQLENCNRFLFIGPHPDDIEIGAGATAAKLAAAGKELCFLICTDGRYGFDNLSEPITPEQLADIRRKEALSAAKVLGVSDVRFANLSDGAFYDVEELSHVILKTISDFQPEVILCPDPSVTSECHSDHLNAGNAAKRAACFASNREIMKAHGLTAAPVQAIAFFMTAKPNRYIRTDGFLQTQLDSIFLCHTSQFPAGTSWAKSMSLYLKLRAYDFGLRSLCKTAEGFRVLGQTHMHCLPEAGD